VRARRTAGAIAIAALALLRSSQWHDLRQPVRRQPADRRRHGVLAPARHAELRESGATDPRHAIAPIAATRRCRSARVLVGIARHAGRTA